MIFQYISAKKAALFFAIIGFLVYFNSLGNGFVWDDNKQVVENKTVQSIKNLPEFFRGSTFYNADTDTLGGFYYKPILSAYYSGIYTLFGAKAFYFHLAQVIIHIFNAILFFILLSYFINNKIINFFLALIFLVHPINVESVSYIAGVQEVLFFFFGIIALLGTVRNYKSFKFILIVFLCLILSLFSKESGILFILITGIYFLIFKKRNIVKYSLMGLVILLIYALARLILAKVNFSSLTGSPIGLLPLSERIKSIPLIIFTYLKTFIFPKDLIISHYWVVKEINPANFYIPLFTVLFFFGLIITAGIKLYRGSKAEFNKFAFFSLWLVSGVAFHIQIFPLDLTYSDRWFYFPMAGLLGMMGVVAENLKIESGTTKTVMTGIAIVVIVIYSGRTIARNADWKSNLTIFEHDTKVHKFPDSYEWNLGLEWNLGIAYMTNQKYDWGIDYFQKLGNSTYPSWQRKYFLGLYYEQKGESDKAKDSFLESMALTKANKRGQIHLPFEKYAILLLHNDSAQKAKKNAQIYLQELPDNPKLWLVLALSEYKLGNKSESIEAAKRAVSLLADEENNFVLSQMEKGESPY